VAAYAPLSTGIARATWGDRMPRFRSADGRIHTADRGASAFALEHGLPYGQVLKLWHGTRTLPLRGWSAAPYA